MFSVKQDRQHHQQRQPPTQSVPKHPRVLKTVNPFRLTPVESEYLSSIALHIIRYQTYYNTAALAVDKLDPSPLPEKLQRVLRSTQNVPRVLSMAVNPRGRVVQENVPTIDETTGTLYETTYANVMNERAAYIILEDLNNIREKIYPFPIDLRWNRQANPTRVVPEAVQQFTKGMRFATADDTYSGNVDYSNKVIIEKEPLSSKYLQQLAQGLDILPDYYLHDFHSVPGGFLSPQHAAVYDLIAETVFTGTHFLSRRMMFRPIAEAMKRVTSQKHHANAKTQFHLLDLGTANGSFILQLLEAFPSLAITGLDLSPAMLDYAKKTFAVDKDGIIRRSSGPPIQLLQANMEDIPVQDETYDFVTQSNCFHEMPQPAIENTAAEIARILKPGGLFLHHDAVQMVDDSSVAKTSRALFDRRFNEPYILDFMEKVDLDAIFAVHGMIPACPPKPYRQATVRCYQKKWLNWWNIERKFTSALDSFFHERLGFCWLTSLYE